MPFNRSEEFINNLCLHSFFNLWSYANPKKCMGSNDELCDVLVVCDPDIIIISIKEREFDVANDVRTESQRWRKKAIQKSLNQIYGAERFLQTSNFVIKSNGKPGINLPPNDVRRIHRIAVAIGSKGRVILPLANNDNSFTHIFDEWTIYILLKELNTIDDFIQYLGDREKFLLSMKAVKVNGGEENLLAHYLTNDHAFNVKENTAIFENGSWEEFIKSHAYFAKSEADKAGIFWDMIISEFEGHLLDGTLEYGNSLNETEKCLRVMAREKRLFRRMLGKSFKEFYLASTRGYETARICPSPSGITYVFLTMPHGEDREYRKMRLGLRCQIARTLLPENETVIGIATEQFVKGKGHSFDACHFYMETISAEFKETMMKRKKELKMFDRLDFKKSPEYEYPTEDPNYDRK